MVMGSITHMAIAPRAIKTVSRMAPVRSEFMTEILPAQNQAARPKELPFLGLAYPTRNTPQEGARYGLQESNTHARQKPKGAPMIDGIPLSGTDLTVGGLYILLVLLLLFERVVPIGRVRSEEKRTEYWQQISEKKDATIATQAEANKVLADETSASFTKVMGAIQDKAGVDE